MKGCEHFLMHGQFWNASPYQQICIVSMKQMKISIKSLDPIQLITRIKEKWICLGEKCRKWLAHDMPPETECECLIGN